MIVIKHTSKRGAFYIKQLSMALYIQTSEIAKARKYKDKKAAISNLKRLGLRVTKYYTFEEVL